MSRPSLTVRPATVDDLPALLELGEELRDQLLTAGVPGRGRAAGITSRAATQARYLDALDDRDRHVVVVADPGARGGEVLGMALLTVAPVNALLDARAVHMSHAVVAGRHRRRGVGRALVAAAAAYAEDNAADQVVVSVNPGSREANRFFARLGFGPMAIRRVASVASVRRRLAADELRPVEHVVRRHRRRMGPLRGGAGLPLGPSTVEEL